MIFMNATMVPYSVKHRLGGFRFPSPADKAECERVYSNAINMLYSEGVEAARQYVEKELDTCTDAYMA